MMTTNKKQKNYVNVGVDIGKSQLDIAIYEKDIYFVVDNNLGKEKLGRKINV